MTVLVMTLVNLLVGVCIGLTGIAGFLLPMYYTGFLNMPASESLALSFAAFLTSGVLGSVNYKRSGNLDIRTGLILSVGSIFGAVLGVRLNLLIPESVIKMILYLVVLLSGISILVRGRKKAVIPSSEQDVTGKASGKNGSENGSESNRNPSIPRLQSRKQIAAYVLLGLVTGAVCAASGAGGPVLVMPLLTSLGFPAHMAVGISLFNSIFIALPAVFGYLGAAAGNRSLLLLLPPLLIAHGIGVLAGSRYSVKINQNLLKNIVAAASIGIACMKLAGI